MPDYSKGRVYKITSPSVPDLVYIGSTCRPLSERMAKHRDMHRRYLAGGVKFVTSFRLIEHGDAEITLIADCPCERKEQLLKAERDAIEAEPRAVNRCIPGRTQAEYRVANRDAIRAKNAEWHVANRDRILEQKAEYRAVNRVVINEKATQKHDCECGGKYTSANRTAHLKTKKHQNWLKNEPAAPPPAAEVEA